MVLHEPRLCSADGDEFRLMGWEVSDEGAQHVQEWDCWLLPTIRR